MTGCQGPVSTANVPALQQQPEAGDSVTPNTTAAPQPAASEVQIKAVKPAAGKVSGAAPKITVEKDVCDLGEIGVDTKQTGQFRFTNTGNAPLKIVLVRSCCGVGIKGVEAGQEYAPGQSGALEFDYQALSMPNPTVTRMLYLQTNDPEQSIITLTIKAAIVRRVDYKPESLRLVLKQPNAGCPDITINSVDGRPFSITDFKATGGVITAEFDPNVKASRFVLKPKADMTRLEQNMRGQISIDLTHPDCRNVRVLYDVLPEFTISPPNIMMFGLKAGQAVQRDIWILGNYQDEFEIESVSSQKGTVKLLEKTKVNNRYQLRIELTPPARESRSGTTLPNPDDGVKVTPPPRESQYTILSDTIEVRIKGGKTLSILVRGFYQEK